MSLRFLSPTSSFLLDCGFILAPCALSQTRRACPFWAGELRRMVLTIVFHRSGASAYVRRLCGAANPVRALFRLLPPKKKPFPTRTGMVQKQNSRPRPFFTERPRLKRARRPNATGRGRFRLDRSGGAARVCCGRLFVFQTFFFICLCFVFYHFN